MTRWLRRNVFGASIDNLLEIDHHVHVDPVAQLKASTMKEDDKNRDVEDTLAYPPNSKEARYYRMRHMFGTRISAENQKKRFRKEMRISIKYMYFATLGYLVIMAIYYIIKSIFFAS